MKNPTQLKALIRNFSQRTKIEPEVILRKYILERFLERVSVSNYKHNFILKGGVLIAAMVGIESRSTMDLDATIKGQSLSETEVVEIIGEILKINVDDGVLFTFRSIDNLQEVAGYPAYRVTLDSLYGKIKQICKIDITTGDLVTPNEINYDYKLMFEDRAIIVLAYNLETILAEKFEAIITKGITNTRMRDYYDIHLLSTTHDFSKEVFRSAVQNTSTQRQTANQLKETAAILESIASSPILSEQWTRYQKKNKYAAAVTWESSVESLRKLARILT